MTNSDDDRSDSGIEVSRRKLVKAVGATTLGAGAFAGQASACQEPDCPPFEGEVRFCGCGRVCSDCPQDAVVLVAEPVRGGGGEFSLREDDPSFPGCYTARRGKIIGIRFPSVMDEDQVVPNPNQCAQRHIDAFDLERVTGNLTIRRGGCSPPSQWD